MILVHRREERILMFVCMVVVVVVVVVVAAVVRDGGWHCKARVRRSGRVGEGVGERVTRRRKP